MLQGMLLAIVIIALAQLPWLVWLWVRERPQTGGGGGGSKRDGGPPPAPPVDPGVDWDSFEEDFRAYTAWTRWTTPVENGTRASTTPDTGDRTDTGDALSG
jgi:hypothetical protein